MIFFSIEIKKKQNYINKITKAYLLKTKINKLVTLVKKEKIFNLQRQMGKDTLDIFMCLCKYVIYCKKIFNL